MNTKEYENFVLNFFNKVGSTIKKEKEFIIIDNVPKTFSDIVGYKEPYKITFDKKIPECELVFSGSPIGSSILKFLDNSGKTTLLKIDFDIDPAQAIKNKILLKNCSIENITKKHKNNFFSRFSFLTSFSFLNEREQQFNEIYVHNNKIVKGDLTGYNVIEGEQIHFKSDFLKKDFQIAKDYLKELINQKTNQLKEIVKTNLDTEIKNIEEYYQKQQQELSTDLNNQIEKIQELELELRVTEQEKKPELRKKISRLKNNLLKISSDEAYEKLTHEKEFTIKNIKQKFSLDITNKVLNTTIIYYPVFSFNLYIKNNLSKRYIELTYDPLTKEFENLCCEECKKQIRTIQLCTNGHITCEDCINKCQECQNLFCKNCLSKTCFTCGKKLCNNCLKVCRGCGKKVCKEHSRIDCVTGEERCINCLRPCSRCHGASEEQYFGVSKDQSKICLKCLGKEKRDQALKNVFS